MIQDGLVVKGEPNLTKCVARDRPLSPRLQKPTEQAIPKAAVGAHPLSHRSWGRGLPGLQLADKTGDNWIIQAGASNSSSTDPS